MSEEIKNNQELSDDQLSTVAGGVSNVHQARLEQLDSPTKSDSKVENIQQARLDELDARTN